MWAHGFNCRGEGLDDSIRRRWELSQFIFHLKDDVFEHFFLFFPIDPDSVDTFVRVYLLPDESEAMQTKIFRNSNNPSYQESFLFFISKQNIKRSLWFHLYHTNAHCTTLIGNYAQIWHENRKLKLFFKRWNWVESHWISQTNHNMASINRFSE